MLISLTVFFEDPFWIGVFERIENHNQLEACRVVFGSEPKEYEVLEYIQKNYYNLQFSIPVSVEDQKPKPVSIKRLKKQAKREISKDGTSTKSQEAIRLQMEAQKLQKEKKSRFMLQEEKKMRFEMHQQKKKEKRRGH